MIERGLSVKITENSKYVVKDRIKNRMHAASETMLFPNSDYPVKAVPYARVLEVLRYEELYEMEK